MNTRIKLIRAVPSVRVAAVLFAGVSCVVAAFPSMASEFIFQAVVPNSDGTSYCWTNTANWVGGVVPGYNDTWVFDPGAGNTLAVTVPTRAGSLYYRFAGIKVKSGTVNFKSGTYLYANGSPTVLDVAEGAKVECNVTFDSFAANSSICKTGAGTFEAADYFGRDKSFGDVDIQEGRLQLGRNNGVKVVSMRIRDSATCAAYSYRNSLGNVHIDKGGKLRVKGGSSWVAVSNLTGEGDVVSDDGASYTDFRIAPNVDSVFSGTMSVPVRPKVMTNATARLILGAGDVFAEDMVVTGSKWLGFAPDVGTFALGRYMADDGCPLNLEDTNGDPVTVRGGFYDNSTVPHFKGSGNFLCVMSGYIRSSDVVTEMTGALGACSGATLTIGNDTAATWPDISGLGGFIVEDGTVALKNKNAEEAVVGGNSIFRSASCKFSATDGLRFGADSTVRFEVATNGFNSGVVPISAPVITFDVTAALEADVAAYRAVEKKRSQLMLATASSSLVLPDEAVAAANTRADGCKFVKSGNSLILEVFGTGGFIITIY
ncbi:MAG: hypothetical protein K6G94_11925 [Kiritimatiellae bacterium]|nr:hypothetical protein [Kiritimatiellia bacterium]